MNDDTLIVVQCYQGDADQIPTLLPKWLHHGCPVLILSPEDSPVAIDHPDVTCRSAGKVGWAGRHTLERQLEHIDIILEHPQRFLLLHDADSVVLSPELPSYLYEHEDRFFSNEVDSFEFLTRWASPERDPLRQTFVERGGSCDLSVPHDCVFDPGAPAVDPAAGYAFAPLVLQPPYFCTRDTLRRMLDVSETAKRSEHFPVEFIDWYWSALVRDSGVDHQAYPDGISYPTAHLSELEYVARLAKHRGVRVVHSVKTKDCIDTLAEAYAEWTAAHP